MSAVTDERVELISRLRKALATHMNDDVSEGRTFKRERFVQRHEAISDTIEYLEAAALVQADAGAVIEMRLCEVGFLQLRPDELYRFTVDENCTTCLRLAETYAKELAR